ncbi:hypothetical protein KCU89_g4, partial [Aureobasidium melanogenum]
LYSFLTHGRYLTRDKVRAIIKLADHHQQVIFPLVQPSQDTFKLVLELKLRKPAFRPAPLLARQSSFIYDWSHPEKTNPRASRVDCLASNRYCCCCYPCRHTRAWVAATYTLRKQRSDHHTLACAFNHILGCRIPLVVINKVE